MTFKFLKLGKIWVFHYFWKSSVVTWKKIQFSFQYGESWGKIINWPTIYRYSKGYFLYERSTLDFCSLPKNLQFLPNPYETWWKWSPHGLIIFTKFHEDWAKVVDFFNNEQKSKVLLSYEKYALAGITM